jgi:hypothetical protein
MIRLICLKKISFDLKELNLKINKVFILVYFGYLQFNSIEELYLIYFFNRRAEWDKTYVAK